MDVDGSERWASANNDEMPDAMKVERLTMRDELRQVLNAAEDEILVERDNWSHGEWSSYKDLDVDAIVDVVEKFLAEHPPAFWRVEVRVRPTDREPLIVEYADTREIRDQLVTRFEQDKLLVVAVPLEFFRVRNLSSRP